MKRLEPVVLPAPDRTRSLSLMAALSARASSYGWTEPTLPLKELSDLLWAANGINRPATRGRTAPSAVDAQDVDLYVCTREGVYLYEPVAHRLLPVALGDHRAKIDEMPPGREPAVLVILVSDLSRFKVGEREHHLEWAAMDSGIVSQNLSLFCAAAGIGTRPRTDMDKAYLTRLLQLRPTQRPMLNQAVGYAKPSR